MIRRPPRSTLDRSSAASDVYKRQAYMNETEVGNAIRKSGIERKDLFITTKFWVHDTAVSYTHLRAHETVLDLVCRLLLEKKQNKAPAVHLIQ